jgi:hypothetical protein
MATTCGRDDAGTDSRKIYDRIDFKARGQQATYGEEGKISMPFGGWIGDILFILFYFFFFTKEYISALRDSDLCKMQTDKTKILSGYDIIFSDSGIGNQIG